MNEIPTTYFLFLAAFLFSIGLAIVISKKNIILILMGIELMLNAGNINLVVFSRSDTSMIQGQLLALFVLIIAAIEASIALALVVLIYKHFNTLELDELNKYKN
ncbi:MAG: NADH-quinone oxidoreductase subunit NuoK [Cytophagales bacterium]|nr:MAG: NADH-quinone oxidoreductase subunit NuoK [Cytophagales bacterium]